MVAFTFCLDFKIQGTTHVLPSSVVDINGRDLVQNPNGGAELPKRLLDSGLHT